MPKKIIYQERKKLGLCVDCNNNAIDGKAYCDKCQTRHLASNQKRRKLRETEGLCIKCGGEKENSAKTKCNSCLKYMNDFMTNRRQKWEQSNCCIDCGEDVIDCKRCMVCYLKMISTNVFGTTTRYQELLDLFNAQNGKCKYTNRIITLQIDCELDHIIPRSKGGADVISNLQWLHRDVNKMKYDLTEEVFIQSITEIVKWLEFQHHL